MNNMTDLLDKIEETLGMELITLPEDMGKERWAKTIKKKSLVTFSRFFPYKITVNINTDKCKGGYYFIDEDICKNFRIIGTGDIDWKQFGRESGAQQSMGFGTYDMLSNNFGLDDVGLLQMRATHASLFDNNIYIDFKPPNMVKLTSVTGQDVSRWLNTFPLELFVCHFDDLSTIMPTKMETFEDLATADVAIYLYNNLKMFDGIETIFANVDLKLAELQQYAESRKDVVQLLKDSYISAGNTHQHLIMCI